ncbi:MAG: hypothetical protein ACM3X0_13625 [Bacteroidota bacterium]
MEVLRGKIISSQVDGGIVSISGNQSRFSLEQHWRSDAVPRLDMVVDVEFDQAGTLLVVRAVSEAELAKEELKRISDHTQKAAAQLVGQASAIGLPIARKAAAEMGVPTLVALAAVLVGWMFLNILTVHILGNSYQGFTFYGVLRLVNNVEHLDVNAISNWGNAGAGIYGFLCYAALAAVCVPHLVRKRHAWFGYTAPFLFMAGTLLSIYLKLRSSLNESAAQMQALGGSRMGDIVNEMSAQMMKAVSLGLGFYIALAAATFLAARGTLKFLATR